MSEHREQTFREPNQDVAAMLSELVELRSSHRFVPQLLAAIERHEEAQNWCTWDNVVNAAQAVKGDEIAQKHLAEDGPWQLDAEGRLP